MLVLLLVGLFIVIPIVEIYVIIQVGQAIGPLWTIALLVADSVLGSMLMRSQGRAAWARFNDAIGRGRIPGREVLDGALIIFGGALLLTPGFVSDIFGALFLVPPTRAVIRRLVARRFAGAIFIATPGDRRASSNGGFDVDGTATEVDPRSLP